MKSFLHEDFLLSTPMARTLYHTHAQPLPIIDYHCHISPQQIWEDKPLPSITQAWLGGDHYKWRALRATGTPEVYITGDADDYDKFLAWAKTLPKLVGNPLYHWTYLELKRYFDYDGPLNADTARDVYDLCNRRLAQSDMSARGIIRQSRVEWIGTTDDPLDSLEYHQRLAADASCGFAVKPAFRPDPALHIHKSGFAGYLQKLGQVSGVDIVDMASLYAALDKRIEYFARRGCTLSDHGLDSCVCQPAGEKELDDILSRAQRGQPVTERDIAAYQTALLCHLGGVYAQRGWVMQLHFSCIRNSNGRMLERLGPDTGFDSIRSAGGVDALAGLLDRMNSRDSLPDTIVYSLNATDNAAIDAIIGAFCSDTVRLRHGAAWWFNDTLQGMTEHLNTLASIGALGTFLGMLTDSRSQLSYTRHEYFRRILCRILGQWCDDGLYPADEQAMAALVRDICYYNVKDYMKIQ
ncbi:MAG: glucuronate isomerase [Eubacteriales bacterium]|nr:glucuronate isomerase [Eubacteriales bacterium]